MRSLKIAGTERWPDLEKDSMNIDRALTYAVDTCSFAVKGNKPAEGEEVIIEDSTRFFAGIIVKVELARTFPSKTIKVWQVECDDYTALLDRRLVVETYENLPADEIFRDIAAKYCPGFTVQGVQSGAPAVEYIVFEYVRPSECFRQLCDYVGWQWQPDYYKDLQFFSAEALASPAPLTLVPGGQFRFGKHSIDTQGLRNRVYVRGGTMLSDPQAIQWKADGVARIWTLPWKPHEVSLAVGEAPMSVGVENLHEEADYDYMMNFSEKYIRCSGQTATPAAGTTMSLTARQDIDVITMVEDLESQAAIAAVQGGDGVYEHVIVDDSLTTIQAAEAAGMADLREHANPRVKGNFETEVPGWAPGQVVPINLPDRGVVGEYLVQKVSLSPTWASPSIWTHRIDYGGRLLGIADFLKALVSAQQKKQLAETAIISKFDRQTETAKVADEIGPTIIHRIPALVLPAPSFARGSVAYKSDGVQVAANVPRFEPGEFAQAVMVEEGTTNLLTANQSSVETDTSGLVAYNGATIVRTTATAWSGVACLQVTTPGENAEGVYTGSVSVAPSTPYTASAWVKGSGTIQIRINERDVDQVFIGETASGSVTLTSSWQRISVTRTFGSSGVNARLVVRTSTPQATTFYVDGLQIEQKPYATSFTDSTRSPETLTIPTAGVLNPQEGTVGFWFTNVDGRTGNLDFWYADNNGDLQQQFIARYNYSTQKLEFYSRRDGTYSTAISTNTVSLPVGTPVFLAFVWLSAYLKIFANGSLVAQLDNPGLPTAISGTMSIGYNKGANVNWVDGLIDDLRISSRARTDAEIAAAYASGEPLPVDEWTAYKLNFDNEIMDYVRTPLCGFVMCSA